MHGFMDDSVEMAATYKTNITGHSALWVPTQSRYLLLLSGCVAKIHWKFFRCDNTLTLANH